MSNLPLEQTQYAHEKQWEYISNAMRTNRLSHGLLLTGPEGVGLDVFAKQLAQLLLCKHPTNNKPCGLCDACHQYLTGNHPDFFELALTEQSKSISIDDIRNLSVKLGQSSHQKGFQVVILNPISALTLAASHALLKTLEEPLGQVVIMGVLCFPNQILATLKSRFVPIPFYSYDSNAATSPLKHALYEASPNLLKEVDTDALNNLAFEVLNHVGKSMVLKQSALTLPSAWFKEHSIEVIQILYCICKDAIQLQLGLPVNACLFAQYPEKIQYISRLLPVVIWYSCLDLIMKGLAESKSATAFNEQYIIENIMIHLQMNVQRN